MLMQGEWEACAQGCAHTVVRMAGQPHLMKPDCCLKSDYYLKSNFYLKCRYELLGQQGQPVGFAVCAQRGKVYVVAAQGSSGGSGSGTNARASAVDVSDAAASGRGSSPAASSAAAVSRKDHIQLALETFQCKEEFKPVY